ncbi:hypothetical protein OUZ56_011898 [Daphnia magna]|uniref:Uncharacterized protein n=1 Tax=Daphnia magna TaxID=35525 RepID=A0ABQ9Z1S2_9CRUS|nr:hypothetical protein OUZ56_011898 [Daphnia magna]
MLSDEADLIISPDMFQRYVKRTDNARVAPVRLCLKLEPKKGGWNLFAAIVLPVGAKFVLHRPLLDTVSLDPESFHGAVPKTEDRQPQS